MPQKRISICTSRSVGSRRLIWAPDSGDVTGDGKPDSALLLCRESAGSGSFYYAVLAVNDGGRYHASNVLALGDRIVPKGIVVIEVFVAQGQGEHSLGDEFAHGVFHEFGIAVVGEASGESPEDAGLGFHLPQE